MKDREFIVALFDDYDPTTGRPARTHIGLIEKSVGGVKHYVLALCGRTGIMKGKASDSIEGEVGCATCTKVAQRYDLITPLGVSITV